MKNALVTTISMACAVMAFVVSQNPAWANYCTDLGVNINSRLK